ncbi:sodium-coupled monocarboxylate transporter 1-like [Lethenteron reissneri]|uniref:sodium-coupled monocarboxylate transporter 1-like n=1 Tax=Lethenteron reissneri TaxID=7753 RepID=UPI002AB733B6|nr:sodium-coupled monocarboxylate transporter 1-like [Lethenteron reissneri]
MSPTAGSFVVWDYLVFAAMLLISASIGVYYAVVARGQQSTEEFLTGGRQMGALPVALSLTASFMSAVTVLGTPAEVYCYGAMFWIFGLTYGVVVVVTAEVYLPVFYRLGITSTNEYLEKRFNKTVRLAGTFIYIIQTTLYTGIVIFAPALALNQVTGFDLWGAVVSTGIICTFYCTMGGLKAVVWTDVFQVGIMVAGFASVIVRGVVVVGDLSHVFNVSSEGGRLNLLDFDPDPRRRHTFWTIIVGGTFTWAGIYGVNQSQVQRYISCRSLRQAKLSLYYNLLGLWLILSCAVLSGLIMFTIYHDCDPWTAGIVGASDQLIPYLTLDILRDFPGVPGLFVACAYSGTLSTVSSSINALAAVTVEDLVRPCCPGLDPRTLSRLSMAASLLYGVVCIAMAVLASVMGSLLQAALSIFGMMGGPLLGLYTLGMVFPYANSSGALVGLALGFGLSLWLGVGAQVYPPLAHRTMPLALSTAGCRLLNATMSNSSSSSGAHDSYSSPADHGRPALADTWYSLSYLYFSAVGTVAVVALGLLGSFLFAGREKGVARDPTLFVWASDSSCGRACPLLPFSSGSNGGKEEGEDAATHRLEVAAAAATAGWDGSLAGMENGSYVADKVGQGDPTPLPSKSTRL